MKRWIKVRASSPEAPVVQRAKRKGPITATPIWIDSFEAPDYYPKLIGRGFLEVLGEADERPPVQTPPPPEPPAAPEKPTKKSTKPADRQEV